MVLLDTKYIIDYHLYYGDVLHSKVIFLTFDLCDITNP